MANADVEKWADQTEKLVIDAFNRGIKVGIEMGRLRPVTVIEELRQQLPASMHQVLDEVMKRVRA
jgi:hypothetical protein